MDNPKVDSRNRRRVNVYIFIDILILFFSFLFFVWLKSASIDDYLPKYIIPFLVFAIIWIFVSVIISKYNINQAKNIKDILIPVIIANLTIITIVLTFIYVIGVAGYSRVIVFGTISLSTTIEIIISYLYFWYLRPVIVPDFDEEEVRKPKFYPVDKSFKSDNRKDVKFIEDREQIKSIIINESSGDVYSFISDYFDVGDPVNLLVSTTTQFNIDKLPGNTYQSITNLHKINDFIRINKFIESVNTKLPYGGVFIDNAETFELRKKRILKRYPVVINYFYYFFDFLFTRVFPKLPVFKKVYFFITLGRNRVLSKAEVLGRLYSCGFECIEERYIDNKLYFAFRKVKVPYYDQNPSYSLLFRMNRIGKGGKIIGIYKFRTMYPYSEYLQEFVVGKYGISGEGKPENDFRLNDWGKFLRRYWLDELPQVINLLKGEIKLVGVRPLSKHFFNLYSEELKEKRLNFKPGLIPPYYADMPKSFESIMESEMNYLYLYEKHPFRTDFSYFFKALFNIVFKGARSK